ncbi:hypothetical protein ACQKP0_24395 [Heyndrickxia sp. NPDC080065]
MNLLDHKGEIMVEPNEMKELYQQLLEAGTTTIHVDLQNSSQRVVI